MVKVRIGEDWLYIDEYLKKQLDNIKRKVTEQDEDRFFIVDGREGTGKSVLTLQLAKYLDPTFTLERCVFNADSFEKAIVEAKKGQVIVFDEAFRGLSSKSSLSKMNKLLIQLMMECRQKNLMVFIVMPTFFMLEKYVAVFRATGLFHVYRNKKGQRGFWMYFNYNTKKKLYDYGIKRYYSYKWPGSNFKGKFTNKYLVDEAEYRKIKAQSLRESFDDNKFDKKDWQRNFMFWYLHEKKGMSTRQISEELTLEGFKIGHTGVYTAIQKFIDFKNKN